MCHSAHTIELKKQDSNEELDEQALSCDLRSKASSSVSKALFLPLQALSCDLRSKASSSASSSVN